MTTRRELIDRMLFTAAQILAEHPHGMRSRDLSPVIAGRLPDLKAQWGALPGVTTWEKGFNFWTVNLVKAGWLAKDKGHWTLTGPGRAALRVNDSPQAFGLAAGAAYDYWNQNRDRFDQLGHLIEAVPEGSWVSAPDLAAETGLDAGRIVHWLQGERPEGWYRVLDPDGGLPDDAEPAEAERQQWLQLLQDDGVAITAGRADPAGRVPGADLRQLLAEQAAGSTETPQRRAWLIRGSSVQGVNLVRSLWLPEGLCSLPASRLPDLAAGAGREQVRAAIEDAYAHATTQEKARLTAEYHMFLSRIRDGDLVVTNDGSQVYLGEVTSGPSFVSSSGNRANLQRTVRWRNRDNPLDYGDLPDAISARLGNPDADLIDLTEFTGDLEQLLGEEPEQPVSVRDFTLPDATEDLAADLLIPREWLQECIGLLRERPQLIFYGPPGTGKTYLAQHLADHLTGGKPENVQLVQFHPSYSYEDFFEGYRPVKGDGGTLQFELSRGPFYRIAEAARAHRSDVYVLVIDEINRGNLAKVFGELYFLLEYRKRAVNLLYGSAERPEFTLPPNVVILGTMNSADRSIALVDTAMRRRFWFQELHPDEPPADGLLAAWLQRHGYPPDTAHLLRELNARIDDRDFRIGPSYLMRPAAQTPAGLARTWRTQILPLLEEHHYGELTRDDIAARYGLQALQARLPGTQLADGAGAAGRG